MGRILGCLLRLDWHTQGVAVGNFLHVHGGVQLLDDAMGPAKALLQLPVVLTVDQMVDRKSRLCGRDTGQAHHGDTHAPTCVLKASERVLE